MIKVGGRRGRVRALKVVLAACAVALVLAAIPAGAIAATRALHAEIKVGADRQEPQALVTAHALAADQWGRPIRGARCTFAWSLYRQVARAQRVTSQAGRATYTQSVGSAPGGFRVWVTATLRWRGQTARSRTSFLIQRRIPSPPRMVFVGDSLTVGLYAATDAQTFHGIVCLRFQCPCDLIGSTGGQSKDADLEAITAARGDLVVVELGTNDVNGYPEMVPVAPSAFATNLRAVAEAARRGNPDSRLVFLTVWQARPHRTPYDNRIRAVAADYGRHVLDISAFKDDPSLAGPTGEQTFVGTSDAWHPNTAGHAAIGAALGDLIADILARQGSSAAR